MPYMKQNKKNVLKLSLVRTMEIIFRWQLLNIMI